MLTLQSRSPSPLRAIPVHTHCAHSSAKTQPVPPSPRAHLTSAFTCPASHLRIRNQRTPPLPPPDWAAGNHNQRSRTPLHPSARPPRTRECNRGAARASGEQTDRKLLAIKLATASAKTWSHLPRWSSPLLLLAPSAVSLGRWHSRIAPGKW